MQVLTRLVTVPVVISHLGLGGFGIWSIIMTTAGYMRFGSVGIRSAFQKYVAEATGNGDYQKAGQLLSTGAAGMFVLSVMGLIPVVLFSGGLARASGVPPEFLRSAALAIATLGLIMILSNAGVAYEAAILGAHRVDLTRTLSTSTCVFEAIGIIGVLHFGFGLFGMSVVMALSELMYALVCYFMSHRIIPQLQIRVGNLSKSVVGELIRFAGSYQLVSVLQMTYNMIAPVAILRAYGAGSAGVYAVVGRLVSPVMMCQYAFLLPLLSGGAMVYASGSSEKMRLLVMKSFKATLALTLLPLSLLSIFGTQIVFAWTGQTDASFRTTLVLVAAGVLFQCLALVGLVFYRSSGRALMDNIREVLRILVLLPVVALSPKLGFYGVLLGMSVAELVGMLFMLFALAKTIRAFDTKRLLNDAARFSVATIATVAAGLLAAQLPFPWISSTRALALARLGTMSVAVLLAMYPVFYGTGAITATEIRLMIAAIRNKPLQA